MNVGCLRFAGYSNFAEQICALIKVNDNISNLFFPDCLHNEKILCREEKCRV